MLRLKWLTCLALTLSLGVGAAVAAECDAADYSISEPAPAMLAGAVRAAQKALDEQLREADVVMLGDSMAGNWPKDLLDGEFEGLAVANYGVSLDRIANVRYRLPEIAVRQTHPVLVLIWAGTNDFTFGAQACAVERGLSELIQDVRESWPLATISVLGIAPRGNLLTDYKSGIEEVNSFLQTNQMVLGYRFLNTSNALGCALNWRDSATVQALAREGAKDFSCHYYTGDNVHLSRAGYVRMSAAVGNASLK